MGEGKSAMRSVTVLAAAASALLDVVALFGVRLEPVVHDAIAEAIVQGGAAILAGIAIYGRLRATQRIGRDA